MTLIALQVLASMPQAAYAQTAAPATTTPIKHVIVIIGENRTFDHVYGTYTPVKGQKVHNLLSEGIVDANGKPRDLHVTRSLGLGLDEKAIEAVEKWKFRPGQKDGHPVATHATIEVNFRLL